MTLALNKSDASPAIASATVAPSSEPAHWEYQTMVAKSPEALVTQANQGGSQSWELVSTVHVLNTDRYQWVGFFKRLKR
jgi:hypothetical protein